METLELKNTISDLLRKPKELREEKRTKQYFKVKITRKTKSK